MIKISVVVPIYNAAQYLEKCIDSVVNQTLKEIEIILVNDGSTDDSAEICEKYLSDERVIYYYKENEGLAAARQDGMDRASGEYVGFVDSDDWLELDMYEKMYEAAKSNDSDVVFCNCMQNEDGHRFSPEMRTGGFNREQIKEEILPKTLAYISQNGGKRSIRWSNCLRIYKLASIKENNINFDRRFRRSQDLHFTYEATLAANNFYYLGNDYFYHNRVVGDSLSRGYTNNMWNLYIPLIERLYKDTEQFTELDLMEQMHLRAFFFATDCIENEFKPLCPNDTKTKVKLISEIVNHPICECFVGHIEVDKLNPLLKGYYDLIVAKKADKIIPFTNKIKRKEQFDKKVIRPIKHFVTEGPVVGSVYKTIKGKK